MKLDAQQEACAELIRRGLTIQDFVKAWNEVNGDTELAAQVRPLAEERYADPSDNDVELDDDVMLSCGTDGIWVSAWVHVSNEQLELVGVTNPEADPHEELVERILREEME